LGRAEQVREVDAVAPRQWSLAAILQGCARSDAAAAQALRGWENGRVVQILARTLGDPAQAQAALDRLLADLASESGSFAGRGEAAAQDWLFARLRLAARKSGADGRPAPKLYAVPSHPSAPETAPPDPTPAGVTPSFTPAAGQWRTGPAAGVDDDGAPDLAGARLRRPTAAAQAPKIIAVPAPGDGAGGAMGWLRALLLLALALLVGGGLAMLAVLWLSPDRPAEVVAPPPAVVAVTPPPPSPAAPPASVLPAPATAPPGTDPAEVGRPIEAREPPVVAAPMERPAQAPAPAPSPAEPAAAPSPRVVVHHGNDRESRAVAEQLGSQLLSADFGAVEVRAVTFAITTASVRYFFDQDRAGAERLATAIGPFLSWHGRAAPGTAIGFTDFRPLPRQGTIEIWLPRR
jgi:hypothetical protein